MITTPDLKIHSMLFADPDLILEANIKHARNLMSKHTYGAGYLASIGEKPGFQASIIQVNVFYVQGGLVQHAIRPDQFYRQANNSVKSTLSSQLAEIYVWHRSVL